MKISTQEEMAEYRKENHARILALNPSREFEILYRADDNGFLESVAVWLDGKRELVT